MKMNSIKSFKTILVMMFCIISFIKFSGCTEDDILAPVVNYAYLSVFHVDLNIGNVEVEINGTVAASNVSYTERLNYQQLTPGNNRVKIINAAGGTIIDSTFFLSENTYHSAFVYASGTNNILKIVSDDLTAPGNINSSVRFINFAINTGSVDVGAVSKTTPWFPFYDYAVASNYRPITGGTYDLYMNNAGTSNTIANLNNQGFTANRVYTIIGKGIAGSSGTEALGLVVYLNQ